MNDRIHVTSTVQGNIVSGTGNVQINGPVTNVVQNTDRKNLLILKWLSGIEYKTHHNSAREERTEGTCTWLLKHRTYLHWKNDRDSSILWLRGDPGVGKTKLTSAVIDEHLQNGNALAYFYFDRAEPSRNDPAEVFCALLKQLSLVPKLKHGEEGTATSSIHELVVKDYDKREAAGFNSGRPNIRECVDVIVKLAECNDQTTIIIDALDEVSLNQREKILDALQNLAQGSATSTKPIKIFVSSRNEDDILLHFQVHDVPYHYIQPHDNITDIQRFITEQMNVYIRKKKLLRGSISEKGRTLILDALRGKAHGMFLWVDLQLKHLCKIKHEDYLADALKALPKDLKEAYDVIYQDILDEEEIDRRMATATIQWVLGAVEPMTADHLLGAIYWSGIEKVFELDVILGLCHNFIVLDQKRDLIRFVHLSAREYLDKFRFSSASQASLQGFVLKLCLRCLTYPIVPACQFQWCKDSRRFRIQLYGSDGRWCKHFSQFQAYSTIFWPEHLKLACPGGEWDDQEGLNLLEKFLGTNNETSGYFIEMRNRFVSRPREYMAYRRSDQSEAFMDFFHYGSPEPLLVASFLGLETFVKEKCLPYVSNINETYRGENALSLASKGGHASLVKLLVKSSADDTSDRALVYTVRRGDYGIARLLLESHMHTKGSVQRVLHAAVACQHWEIVKLLVEFGADFKNTESLHYTLLYKVAASGKLEMVRWLLDNGVNVNVKSVEHETALQVAALYGHSEVVELLVDRGAEINANPGFPRTALEIAAKRGFWKIVELLVDKGADKDKDLHGYRIAISRAVEARKWTLVRRLVLILEADKIGGSQDVNHQHSDLYQAAISRDWDKVTQLVLSFPPQWKY